MAVGDLEEIRKSIFLILSMTWAWSLMYLVLRVSGEVTLRKVDSLPKGLRAGQKAGVVGR